jgi:predicted CXXCH cytochrome family protein
VSRRIALTAVVLAAFAGGPAFGDLQTSKHNLSTSGPGTITAESESRTCVFCHTPHNANPAVPLWNHASSVAAYSPYSSTTLTLAIPPDQPTGSSKLCLSCHDGTVALGQTVNDGLISLFGTDAGGRLSAGPSDLGPDLTDDHPVSFQPNPTNPETLDPPAGDAVKLDPAGEVQCVSCHDPHTEDRDAVTRRFLVKRNQRSAICTTCHQPEFWSTNPSSHESSASTYTTTQGAHTGYTTVRDNGCESCHRPHSGNEPQRILKFVEEQTCDRCHDGAVASKNVASVFSKAYNHPTYSVTPSVHDAAESPGNMTATLPEIAPGAERHAECQDCHDPHASYSQGASAPDVSGALNGTWGIDSSGVRVDPARYEYEVCYKCHADSANKPQESGLPDPPYTRRQIVQFNARLEFDPASPSHHAVESPGRNPDVPSLIPRYTENSVMYCTDCHDNDAGPAGPHGSQHLHIMERNLNYGDGNSGENYAQMYALCFKCHDQTSIFGDQTFEEHSKHVRGEDTSCTVCHDPHGVSATQGNGTENSHLINFDLDVVSPNSAGQLRFEDRGNRSGACYLSCHGDNHDPETY